MAANPNANVKKFLPKNYLGVLGKNLPAIYEAINRNIKEAETLVQACIDQLFLSTASGRYLIQLGEEQGFVMPANSGLDIRSYRVLVPLMVASPKQVRLSIDELVQAFYQNDRTKPSVLSTIAGPYSLESGDDFIVETENGVISVSVIEGQVSDLTNVSAQEVAAVMNSSQDVFSAEAITDRTTGLASVRITSQSFGTGAFIRVAGGKLQNILKLPNLVNTLATASTTWNLTKTSEYSDELRIQWDGVGTNPNVYLAKPKDVLSIRGLVDGTEAFSVLNGSYELVDVGYDYVVIRNSLFDVVSATLVQGADNAFVFTKSDKISIFDGDEFALTSETKPQTITVTVPAVPPLARRFLQGSAHVHGGIYNVLDFTRSTIQVDVGSGQDLPQADNHFVFRGKYNRPDFMKKYYKTIIRDTNLTQPTYVVDTSSDIYQSLPYTIATSLGNTEVIFATIESGEYKAVFSDYRHGLQNTWGFTIADMAGAANILAGDLNKEHVVRRVENQNTVVFGINDISGNPIIFDGIAFGNSSVFRHSLSQSDGSDFYMDFGTGAAAIASGLTPGITLKLDPSIGVNSEPYLAGLLRSRILTVTSVFGSKVNISAGLGTGPQGTIIIGVPGVRSGLIGGTSGTYFLDKTSDQNVDRVFSDLQTIFIGHTPSSNALFLGPYIFDPDGEETNLTVSGILVKSNDTIFKGESKTAIFVDDSTLGDKVFPQNGKIVIDYGTSSSEGPINYLAYVTNPGSTQILVDPAYRFKKSHSPDAQIQFVRDTQPYVPEIDGSDFPMYLTGTTESRNTLFKLVELLVASGIFVEADVILPELRYADPSLSPFE